jgi:bilirubin oxidase
VLVDLTDLRVGDSLDLQSFHEDQAFGFPDGEPDQRGEFGSLLNDTTFDVLHIDVGTPEEGGVDSVPDTLATTHLWSASDATVERTIAITDDGPGTPFSFDNQAYDDDVINQHVRLGDTEKWTVTNNRTFGHAFHIHDVQFSIVSRSGGEVSAHERDWKDTVFVPIGESVSFVALFEDFAHANNPYVYQCHMANHEDGGLMGQFLVA